MGELLRLIKKLDIRGLLLEKTENEAVRFFRYLFVGGIAFVADYGSFTLATLPLGKTGWGLAGATTVGFLAGVTVNYLLSKRLVFTQSAVVKNPAAEFLFYGLIGLGGWGLNVLLMLWFETLMNVYLARILVSLLVLVYNYLARRLLLYRK